MLKEYKSSSSKSLSIHNETVATGGGVSWTFTNCSSYTFVDFTETNETTASVKFLDPITGDVLATSSLTAGTPIVNDGYSSIKVIITNTQGQEATFDGQITCYDVTNSEASGSNTQVQFNDSGVLAGNAGLTFNKSSGALSVSGKVSSGDVDTMTVNGAAITSNFAANSDSLAVYEAHSHTNTAGNGAYFYNARSRGTNASPTIVQSGDTLGAFCCVGFDGTDYATSTCIISTVDGTPGSNDMPGKLSFRTSSDGTQDLTERMSINSSGAVNVSGLTASTVLASDSSKNIVSVGSATNGHVLVADSAQSSGVKWQTKCPNMGRIYRSTAQTIGTGAWTDILWDSESFDLASEHSTSENSDRVTVSTTGYYRFYGSVGFNPSATGDRGVELYKNGTTSIKLVIAPASSASYAHFIDVDDIILLSANDYITLRAYQQSGGNLNIYGGSAYTTLTWELISV